MFYVYIYDVDVKHEIDMFPTRKKSKFSGAVWWGGKTSIVIWYIT